MSEKKEIMVFVDWYLPGYKAGGPIRSVANLVSQLSNDFNFSIVTSDTDYGEKEPYPDLVSGKWLHDQNVRIMYLSRTNETIGFLRKLMRNTTCDQIYINSLFSWHYALLPLLIHKISRNKTPVIVAPRGMLGKGALSHKFLKKKFFLSGARWSGLFNHVTWHATNEEEEKAIHQYFGDGNKIIVAPNIAFSKSNITTKEREKRAGSARFFYLSRIMGIKNLKKALNLLELIRVPGHVEYDIIGPVEDEQYWNECKIEIDRLKEKVCVNYLGAQPYEKLPSLIKDYHFLLLPTTNENYGHSIVESFAAGCPVIISDQTPWKNLEEKKIGWDIPLGDNEYFKTVLEKCVNMTQEEYTDMSKKTLEFAGKHIFNGEAIIRNRKLFE